MMNRSGSAETYFPPMASFSAAALEATSPRHYLCDWETANATLPPVATAVSFPFDCSPPLPLPMNNHQLSFYPHPPPLLPEYMIKREDGIGLNLGQRTYFSSGDGGALEVDRLLGSARSRAGGGGVYSHHQPPRCQAEGCKADLSGAKHYHRRHKVCEFHSKATVVVAHGLQQRFCQQCSRFHVLAEFDEAKRSCRKRLADHNRRRRKPQLLMPPASTKSIDQSSSSINKHQVQEQPTREITSSKPTMAAPVGLLSLGGVGGAEERGGGVYQSQVNLGGVLLDEKLAAASNISESSSGFIFHHCNTLSSDSNEGTPSRGGSHSHIHTRSHSHSHSHSHHHQPNLHLGQSMFELDFM